MTSRRTLVAGIAALACAGVIVAAIAVGAGGDEERSEDARAGRWTALHPATLARTEVAAARIGRFVYVVGGFEQRSKATTAAAERYDIVRDRWHRLHSMPVGLNHPAAASYDGDVYVLGGYASRGGLTDEVSTFYRYDPRRDRWSRLESAPTRRGALAVGVIGGRLYAAGGASAGRPLKTLEIYDFKRRRWSRGPDMAVAREHLAGAVTDGAFYVLAGRAAGLGNFAVAERYVPSKRRWERIADMKKPRGGIAAAAVGRRVIVFGGEEARGTIGEVEMYDPALRRWTGLPDMKTSRHGLGGVSRGRRVYSIEGGPEPGLHFSNAIETLTIK
jgi:N-acetylneuraminic acid mutarotase